MTKSILAMSRTLLVFSLITLGLPACSTDAEAVCEAKCECERCSDVMLDDCYFDAEDKEREADRVGCLDLWDELKACEYDTGICRSSGDWDTNCDPEKQRWDNCRP